MSKAMGHLSQKQQNAASSALTIMDSTTSLINKMLKSSTADFHAKSNNDEASAEQQEDWRNQKPQA